MELSEFLEKFLPEYRERLNRFKIEEGYTPVAFEINGVKEFCVRNFPEALENFADRLCEKQRTECMNTYVLNEDDINRFICIEIQNCKQPEIEEL